MNKVFIIIVNWNGKKILATCLSSIIKADLKNAPQIVVVDNNSTDGSQEMVRKSFPKTALLQNKTNLGWAGGNNVGIKYVLRKNAKYVLLLNNDVTIDKNTIPELISSFNKVKNIGIVGPKTYYDNKSKNIIADAGGLIEKNRFFGVNRGQGEKDLGQYKGSFETDFISGSAMMVKSEVFEKVGFFDESFYLYYEDTDFCLRAKKCGYLSIITSKAIVYHKFGQTSKIGSPLHNYFTTRNHFLFVQKHAPFRVKLKEFIRTPKTAYEFLRSNNGKYSLLGIRDYYLRKFGKQIYW